MSTTDKSIVRDTEATVAAHNSSSSVAAPARKRFRWARFASLGLIGAAVAFAASSITSESTADSAASSIANDLEPVHFKPVRVGVQRLTEIEAPQQWLPFRGTVDPRRESTLAFRRSGRIEVINVDVGAVVERGTVLAKLDTSDLRVQSQIADAELAVAQAMSDEAEAGPRQQTIAAAQARVTQLSATLKAAEFREQRQKKLFEQRATSLEKFQNEQQLVRQLQASVKEAEEALAELEAGTRSEQIKSAEASVSSAKASRAMIDVQQSDSMIIAPYKSVVSARLADEGSIVGPDQPILTVLEEPPLEASFGLPSQLADTLYVGKELIISVGHSDSPQPELLASTNADTTASTSGTYVGPAKVVRLSPRVDNATRMRNVVLEFPAKSTALIGRPAMLWLDARLAVDNSAGKQMWVPSGCVVRGVRGLWGVYTAEKVNNESSNRSGDTIVVLHDVKILETAGAMSRVATALPDDALVITRGTHRVGPGVAVDFCIASDGIDCESTEEVEQ